MACDVVYSFTKSLCCVHCADPNGLQLQTTTWGQCVHGREKKTTTLPLAVHWHDAAPLALATFWLLPLGDDLFFPEQKIKAPVLVAASITAHFSVTTKSEKQLGHMVPTTICICVLTWSQLILYREWINRQLIGSSQTAESSTRAFLNPPCRLFFSFATRALFRLQIFTIWIL